MQIKENIRCIIVDDQMFAIKILEGHLVHFPTFSIDYAGTDIYEALRIIDRSKIDLVFLDIQMPDMNGMQFLKLCKNKCKFIFTTAYSQYAIEGYEHDVVDFLLKPITYERFKKSILKFNQHTNIANTAEPDETKNEHILIKGDAKQKYHKVLLKNIVYVKGLDNYISIQTIAGPIITYMNLKDLIALLPSTRFCRIHKSFIVSVDYINYVDKSAVKVLNEIIPIGLSYKKNFFQLWETKLNRAMICPKQL